MRDTSETKWSVTGPFDLSGRVALVAGGAGYLGSALCQGLLHRGAKIVIADVNQTQAERIVEELNGLGLGPPSRAFPLDINQEESIRQLVGRVQTDFDHLDILINATAAPQVKMLQEITGQDFAASLKANLAGSFLLAREARLAMRRGGSIILFSSMYARVAPDPRLYYSPLRPNAIEYGVGKAGIEQMVRYLAVAWAGENIRVNGIAPGPFPSPKVQKDWPDFAKRLAQRVPLGRIGFASEIIGPTVFLASDASSYVTGEWH